MGPSQFGHFVGRIAIELAIHDDLEVFGGREPTRFEGSVVDSDYTRDAVPGTKLFFEEYPPIVKATFKSTEIEYGKIVE